MHAEIGGLVGDKWKLGDRRFKCQRCGWEWTANKDNEAMASGLDRPSFCPNSDCRSHLWWIPVKTKQAKNKRIKNAKGVLVNE